MTAAVDMLAARIGYCWVRKMSELEPLLVSVVNAREMLGGIGHNQFWALVKAGELELVGSTHKRWVTVASLKARVARMLATAQQPSGNPRKRAEQPNATA